MPNDSTRRTVANHIEKAERCLEVYKLLLKGVSRPEVVQFCAEKWGVTDRTADNYIALAKTDIYERIERDFDRSFALMHHRLEDLYKRSMKLQDYKTALAILKEHGALHNLYPAKRHELAGKDGGDLVITVKYEDGANG